MDNIYSQTVAFSSFHPWKPATALCVSGEDAFTFLQGQFTNDLRELETKGTVYGLWLNHKGRVIADSFVHRLSNGLYWIGSYFCPADVIRERLESFVIADDVVIEDVTSAWSGLTLFGELTDVEKGLGENSAGFSFVGRRTARPHREFVFPTTEENAYFSSMPARQPVDAEELERIRIGDAIASVPNDIGPGELPNEGGLEGPAISYNKGCYLGQEVMARLKSMGQVRRRLLQVEGASRAPSLPAPLFQGDRRIGELRTAVGTPEGFIGLALFSLLNLQRDVGFSLSPGAEAELKLVKQS